MLRKLSLVAVAAASLGAAALAPTSASAWGGHHGWHGGWHGGGWGGGGPRIVIGGPGLLRLRLRRLLRAAIGPNAVGTSLAVSESLLLSCLAQSEASKPRPLRSGLL